MRPELPSGTVTFLFTDVEGSTRLLHELGAEAYAEALAEHRRVVREACAAQGGVEVDTQGDAFFFAFPTAPGALAAASELARALEPGPVQVRVGVHTGAPLLTDEGYVGSDVHRAARIASAGHGGQVLVSASTAALLDVELRDLGEHRLKDLSAPQRIYQLGDADFPRLEALSRTNLPVPATPFLGREEELREVAGLLARDDVRLLTLTGPGGTGKTRLALQAAAAASGDYPDGVFWVALAGIRHPDLVIPHVAQALEATAELPEAIGDKRLLLVLDNFEQVVQAAPGVAALLAACPRLKVIVTSREPLHVSGEQECAIAPLASPEATDFFVSRARSADPSFAADGAVVEICRRLDNLPLALELAAARVKVLSAVAILARLEKRLPLLTSVARDAPERQRTLSATIEWSCDLLSEEEQRLFRRLSVFSGGSTFDTAEDVAGAALDTLQSLVDKSLLRRTDARYWMLETIREFARERLDGSGESESLQRRHAERFALEAEAANREYMYGTQVRNALLTLRAEQENLRDAIEWAALAGEIELQLSLIHTVRTFWHASGFTKELQTWLETALARDDDLPAVVRARALANLGENTPDPSAAIGRYEQAAELYRSVGDEEGVARCLVGIGRKLTVLDRAQQAREIFEDALRTARRAESVPVTLGALTELAFLALSEGDLDRVTELAAAIAEREPAEAGFAPFLLGRVALERGDITQAMAVLAASLAETHKLGVEAWLSPDLDGLAAAFAARGDFEQAAILVGQSQALRTAHGRTPDVHSNLLLARVSETATRALGDEGFAAETARGAEMSVDKAVEFALAQATDA